jgi:PAS domain S-box-containing protein
MNPTDPFVDSLLQVSGDGIVVTDSSHKILLVNEAFCTLIGKDPKDLLGTSLTNWIERCDPAGPRSWLELTERIRREGSCRDLLFNLKGKDCERHFGINATFTCAGARSTEKVLLSIWRDNTGEGLAGKELRKYKDHLDDLVEQRTAELKKQIAKYHRAVKALRKERDFTKSIIDATPAFFVGISAKGKTLMMNERMLETLGYEKDEVVGTDYLNTFVPEPDREFLKEVFARLVHERQPTLNLNPVLTKDGRTILVEWRGRPVFDDKGNLDYFFGVGIDVTKRSNAT